MSTDIKKLLTEFRAGLEGVTPGPWHVLGYGFSSWVATGPPGQGRSIPIQHGSQGEMRERDAAHIARCYPENISALLDELETALTERDAAREQSATAVAVAIDGASKIALEEMDALSHKLKDAFSALVLAIEARTEAAEARAEELEKALAAARHEASCCDDIPLNQPLNGIISDLQSDREYLRSENVRLRAALAPFSDMGGEMFARGWDASNVALALDNPNDAHRVTAGDFFRARRLSTLTEEGKP